MNRSNRALLVVVAAAVIALAVVGYLWYASAGLGGVSMSTTTPTSTGSAATTTQPSATATTSVRLAMLDINATSNGKSRGCDRVVMVPWNVATTSAPLTAALQSLFAISTTSVSGWFNFIDRTNETLQFDHATVSSGVAHIYLTGSLSGLAGVCDDPRAQIQIEETALQFSTVQSVRLYLNNALVTSLAPSMK